MLCQDMPLFLLILVKLNVFIRSRQIIFIVLNTIGYNMYV